MLDPGAGTGEGVAGCISNVPATRGQPCLGVETSTVGKVGEGADPGAIGVDKLQHSVGTNWVTDSGIVVTTRYKDH